MTATIPYTMQTALLDCFGTPRKGRNISIEYKTDGPYLNVRHMTDSDITIALSEHCNGKDGEIFFAYQLAHELVHTLDPVPFGEASILEEGCATYFQYWYIRTHHPESESVWHWPIAGPYKEAHELVRPIFEADFYALKRLRNSGLNLSLDDAEALAHHIPFLDIERARSLVGKFEQWRSGSPA